MTSFGEVYRDVTWRTKKKRANDTHRPAISPEAQCVGKVQFYLLQGPPILGIQIADDTSSFMAFDSLYMPSEPFRKSQAWSFPCPSGATGGVCASWNVYGGGVSVVAAKSPPEFEAGDEFSSPSSRSDSGKQVSKD